MRLRSCREHAGYREAFLQQCYAPGSLTRQRGLGRDGSAGADFCR